MAFVRDLKMPCRYPGCGKVAVLEVVNNYNASIGCFCRPHAMLELRGAERREREAAKRMRDE